MQGNLLILTTPDFSAPTPAQGTGPPGDVTRDNLDGENSDELHLAELQPPEGMIHRPGFRQVFRILIFSTEFKTS